MRITCDTCCTTFNRSYSYARHLKSANHLKCSRKCNKNPSQDTSTDKHERFANVVKEQPAAEGTGKLAKSANCLKRKTNENILKSPKLKLIKITNGTVKVKSTDVNIKHRKAAKEKLKQVKTVKRTRKKANDVQKSIYCKVCKKSYKKIRCHLITEKHKAAERAKRRKSKRTKINLLLKKGKTVQWNLITMTMQLNLVISTSLISNNRLSRSENLVPV